VFERGFKVATVGQGLNQGLTERDKFVIDIQDQLLEALETMKYQQGNKHCPVKFHAGEWLWLCLQHHPVASLASPGNAKLSPWSVGPYQILESIPEMAYHLLLLLSPRARIHDVFHVVFLVHTAGDKPRRTNEDESCYPLRSNPNSPSNLFHSNLIPELIPMRVCERGKTTS
jgi:hypothetical protein